MTAAATVVVDAKALGDDSAFRGVGTYVRHVLDGLAARDDLSVTALALPGTTLPATVTRRRLRRWAPGRFAQAEHDLRLPFDLARTPGDVVFSPALDPPRRCARPWVQTLHDAVDEAGLEADPRRWRAFAERTRRATAVVAISTQAADRGIRLLGLDAARVHVVHHGVDDAFRRVERRPTDPPYLLVVAEYSPRKGYAEAMALIGALAEAGYPHRLRIAGRLAPWVRPVVEELVARAPRPDRIDLLGHVGHLDELPTLYAGADAYVCTSQTEGFGLPTAEAMATGAPVLAFANSATVEVVGDAGDLVPDGDVAALVAVARRLLDDPALRADRSAAARERAALFDWGLSVAAHAELLRAAATDPA